jgi:hypothetical protein
MANTIPQPLVDVGIEGTRLDQWRTAGMGSNLAGQS